MAAWIREHAARPSAAGANGTPVGLDRRDRRRVRRCRPRRGRPAHRAGPRRGRRRAHRTPVDGRVPRLRPRLRLLHRRRSPTPRPQARRPPGAGAGRRGRARRRPDGGLPASLPGRVADHRAHRDRGVGPRPRAAGPARAGHGRPDSGRHDRDRTRPGTDCPRGSVPRGDRARTVRLDPGPRTSRARRAGRRRVGRVRPRHRCASRTACSATRRGRPRSRRRPADSPSGPEATSWSRSPARPAPVTIDRRAAQADARRQLALSRGAVLRLGRPSRGLRTYVAVRGGLAVTRRSAPARPTCLPGWDRRRLRRSSPPGRAGRPRVESGRHRAGRDRSRRPALVAVRLGPRDDRFTAAAVAALGSATYEVTSASNRVGLRLDGPRLEVSDDDELPSEGMVPGALQVPPSGQPTLLLGGSPGHGRVPGDCGGGRRRPRRGRPGATWATAAVPGAAPVSTHLTVGPRRAVQSEMRSSSERS